MGRGAHVAMPTGSGRWPTSPKRPPSSTTIASRAFWNRFSFGAVLGDPELAPEEAHQLVPAREVARFALEHRDRRRLTASLEQGYKVQQGR